MKDKRECIFQKKSLREAVRLRFAVIDDNTDELHMTEVLIRNWCVNHSLTVCCDTFTDGNSFLLSAASNTYDLVFFDIYLEEANGIDLAAAFRRLSPKTPIIFLTSSPEHHAEALHVHAFDYLEKPITQNAIDQVLQDLLAVQPVFNAHLFLTVTTNKTKVPILYSDIRYITSDSNYLIIHTQEELRCRMLFRTVTLMLSKDDRFLTINRGIMVNLDHVSSMEGFVCTMDDGTTLFMNKKQANALQQAYVTRQFTQRTKSLLHGGPA